MPAVLNSALVLLYLLCFPALARWLVRRYAPARMLGAVVLCYAGGILFSLSGWFQPQSVALSLSEVLVPLAIPLLLMGRNLWVEIRQTGKLLFSFGLACFSVCLMSLLVGWLFQAVLPESWKLAGMMAGVYTGGTPNLVSVGQSLAVSKDSFLLIQGADVVSGGLFLMVLLSLMKPLTGYFLKPFAGETDSAIDGYDSHWRLRDMAWGLLASGIIAAFSLGASWLVFGALSVPVVMCLLTLGGLLASGWPALNRLQGTDQLGDYLIQSFCVAIGAQIQLGSLFSSSGTILLFVGLCLTGTVCLQLLLAWCFKLDVDSTLMAMAASIYGPPFIAPVAEAIRNRSLIGPGLTLGVLGYAIGTWLGLAMAYLLKGLLGL